MSATGSPPPTVPPTITRGPGYETAARSGPPFHKAPWFRRSVKILGAVVTVLMVTVSTVRISESATRSTRAVDTTVELGDITTVRVKLAAGHVRFESSAPDSMSTAGTTNSAEMLNSTITVSGEVTSGFVHTDLDIDTVGNELVVASSCPAMFVSRHCQTDLTITVPPHVDVEMDASHVDVTLDHFDSDVHLNVDRASVRGQGAAGDIMITGSIVEVHLTDLHSNNVDITSSLESVTLEFLTPPGDVRVRANFMPILVVVPDTDDAYDVRLSTQLASTINNIRNDPSSDRVIDLRSTLDDVEVRYRR